MLVEDSLFIFVCLLMFIVGILIGVAFLVLLERKLLGYIQDRKGPNKVVFLGIFQPFSDAIKLFVKEYILLIKINLLMYFSSPMFGFFMALMLLVGLPLSENLFSMNLFLLYMMSCLSIGVYIIMMSGWASNSNYSMLGGVRSVAQSLSYEVSMFLIFFVMFLYVESFKLIDFFKYQDGLLEFWYMNSLVFILLFISMVAELNRMPFDFIEGESELVSGFNIEYMSGGFTLIFLAEYMMILILGILYSLMFMGGSFNMKSVVEVLIFSILIIWIRGCFPRLRYDNLMYFCWYYILSMIMLILLIVFVLKYALWLNI
uniref:NADH-ubiquinone oxidoreductase chain 1 n=1 Tax=Vespula vulgaris TaxID=7454 RepID=A0A514LQW1_VESVU|nr:NADH dehydrogenase subunit 1 [Vespula vulgaris]QDI94133.1 NADH dehydrogenase subunit 1 [Vespula vulgaris]QDI94146.1 NADH dehydrogenase subunit 1 [Vespula vulgaris]QDI94159.1 NADH dehydrogenase subunit 1 [Vespula vulgaris]QDI94172.1 NADH dehydrogenase subunit 1 [Vespula vulgaris]